MILVYLSTIPPIYTQSFLPKMATRWNRHDVLALRDPPTFSNEYRNIQQIVDLFNVLTNTTFTDILEKNNIGDGQQDQIECLAILSRFVQHCFALGHLTKAYLEDPIIKGYPNERKVRALALLKRAHWHVETGQRFSEADPHNPNIRNPRSPHRNLTGISYDDIYLSSERTPSFKQRFNKRCLDTCFSDWLMKRLESAFDCFLREVYDRIILEKQFLRVGHLESFYPPINNDVPTLPLILDSSSSVDFIQMMSAGVQDPARNVGGGEVVDDEQRDLEHDEIRLGVEGMNIQDDNID